MDLKQLKALVLVADVGSVTKAAELLHVVQPAVTRYIRALEKEFGTPLFERTRLGMRPTEAGAALAERARRALTELDRARAELTPSPGTVAGIVTVGLLASTAETLAEPLVTAVLREHPGVELRVLTAYSGYLQQWLDAGDVDLSLLYDLTSTPSLNVTPLVDEQLWVAAGPSGGLRADRPVPLAEVVTHPLVMPQPGHGLYSLISNAAHEAGAAIEVAVHTNSMGLQKQFTLAGHGWTILPSVGIAEDLKNGVLTAAPVTAPEIRRTVVLGMPRTVRVAPAVQVVATALVREVRAAVEGGRWPSGQLR